MLRNCSLDQKAPEYSQEVDLLVSSGAFVRKNNGISFSDDFVSYVARHYPDVTVSSALKELGSILIWSDTFGSVN